MEKSGRLACPAWPRAGRSLLPEKFGLLAARRRMRASAAAAASRLTDMSHQGCPCPPPRRTGSTGGRFTARWQAPKKSIPASVQKLADGVLDRPGGSRGVVPRGFFEASFTPAPAKRLVASPAEIA